MKRREGKKERTAGAEGVVGLEDERALERGRREGEPAPLASLHISVRWYSSGQERGEGRSLVWVEDGQRGLGRAGCAADMLPSWSMVDGSPASRLLSCRHARPGTFPLRCGRISIPLESPIAHQALTCVCVCELFLATPKPLCTT